MGYLSLIGSQISPLAALGQNDKVTATKNLCALGVLNGERVIGWIRFRRIVRSPVLLFILYSVSCALYSIFPMAN